MRCWFALAAALALSACGQPDNLVLGGIGATSTTPAAFIPNVRSSIFGVVSVNALQMTLVVLSDRANLCQSVTANPNYFNVAPEPYVALLLFAPTDQLGVFQIGRQNTNAFLVATSGSNSATQPYQAILGNISFADSARGSFDVLLDDKAGRAREVTGRFKANSCDGLKTALF